MNYTRAEKKVIKVIYKSLYKEPDTVLSADVMVDYFRDLNQISVYLFDTTEKVNVLLGKRKRYERLLFERPFASSYIRIKISTLQNEIFEQLANLDAARRYIAGSLSSVNSKVYHTNDISVEKIETILSEVKSLKEQYPDTFEIKGTILSYTTNEITLRDCNGDDHELGRFKVSLRLGKRIYNVNALDPNPCAGNSAVVHPHVHGNRMCEGDAAESISFALSEFRLCDFFDMVSGVLNNYGSDNPYERLEDWEGLPCQSCNDTVSSDDSYYCESCEGSPLCNSCVYHCEGCCRYYCNDCTERCCECRDRFCTDCVKKCEECGDWVCESCVKKCARCDSTYCSSCIKHCDNCEENYCSDCNSECEACGNTCCQCLINECQNCGEEVCENCMTTCKSCRKDICDKCKKECGNCDRNYCTDCISKCCDCGEDLCEKCSIPLDCSHNVSCDCCAKTCDCGNSNCKECICSCKGESDGPEIIS